MIPVKPLYAELTQPLYRDLPGQAASDEDSRQSDLLTSGLARSLPETPAWMDRGDDGDDAA